MAPKRDLARLFRHIATEDWAQARTVAEEIANSEAERGHHVLAAQLRSCLAMQRPTAVSGSVSPPTASNTPHVASAALSALHAPVQLTEVAMPKRARTELIGLLQEHKHQEALMAEGLNPRRRLLIHGPPGCGKSMTARAIATELGLPVFVVRLDAIVGAYLGQTASRLRELFRFSETMACVLLIDEIDALGRSRGDVRDIGELDRVAISLMQELEHSEPKGLLVATSNIAAALDRALLRRFDMTLEFKRPSRQDLAQFARREARNRKLKLGSETKQEILRSENYATALRTIADAQRDVILKGLSS